MNEEKVLDVIGEVINHGIGEAASALSALVDQRVVIQIPELAILAPNEVVAHIRREAESVGVFISQDFEGFISGKSILFYTRESGRALLRLISQDEFVSEKEVLSELDMATLNEIGNIILTSYLAEISDLLDTRLKFGLPEGILAGSENYFNNLISELGDHDKVLVVKNEMRIKDSDIENYVFVLLSFKDFICLSRKLADDLGI